MFNYLSSWFNSSLIENANTPDAHFRFGAMESPVDIAYREGRTYRTSLRVNLPSNSSELYIKYVTTGDTDLTLSSIACNKGAVLYEVFVASQASGETGITTPIPIYRRNNKSDVAARPSAMVLTRNVVGSGALTLTGEPNSVVLVRTDKKDLTVYGDDSRRGFPAGTFYVRVKGLEGDNNIILDQEWVEYD